MKPGLYETLERIAATINERRHGDAAKSYVAQLFAKGDDAMLKSLIQRHLLFTGSERARVILENWAAYLPRFVKVMPLEYRRALSEQAAEQMRREQPAATVEVRAND